MQFQSYNNEEAHQNQDKAREMKETIMSILSHQKAMALMLLHVLSFIISAYFLIQLIQMDTVIALDDGHPMTQFDLNGIFYVSLILSALVPMFFIAVYLYSKKQDEEKVSKWLNYGKIYMQISLVLTSIVGAFAVTSIVGVLFVIPLLGIFLFFFMSFLFGMMIWFIILVIRFLKTLKDNLFDETIHEKADPSKVIFFLWLMLIISTISFINGLLSPTYSEFPEFQDMIPIINQLTLYSGILGLLSTVFLMAVLYDIKNQYTNHSF